MDAGSVARAAFAQTGWRLASRIICPLPSALCSLSSALGFCTFAFAFAACEALALGPVLETGLRPGVAQATGLRPGFAAETVFRPWASEL